MPNFLENIFSALKRADARVVLREIHGHEFVSVTGKELLEQVQQVRAFLRDCRVQPGDRCGLLAPNSIRWVVFDLALMAERMIVVPLYSRQVAGELAGMMKDCEARLLFVSDEALSESVVKVWSEAPRRVLFEEALTAATPRVAVEKGPLTRKDSELVASIY